MSLTSGLRDPRSFTRQTFAELLPDVGELRSAWRAQVPRGLEILSLPTPDIELDRRLPYSTIGMTIDHRLRLAFTGKNPAEVAAEAVAWSGDLVELGEALMAEIRRVVDEWHPYDRACPFTLGDDDQERRLVCLCYAASLFEEIFRSGQIWPGSPLSMLDHSSTLDDLFSVIPSYVIDDIVRLVQIAADSPLSVLRKGSTTEGVITAPTFAGSGYVGGADADMIVEGLLVDWKCTINPRRFLAVLAWQLAGYALLDFDDQHHINSLGIYLVRSGKLVTWPLEDYLTMCGATLSLPELRASLKLSLEGHWSELLRAREEARQRYAEQREEIQRRSDEARQLFLTRERSEEEAAKLKAVMAKRAATIAAKRAVETPEERRQREHREHQVRLRGARSRHQQAVKDRDAMVRKIAALEAKTAALTHPFYIKANAEKSEAAKKRLKVLEARVERAREKTTALAAEKPREPAD